MLKPTIFLGSLRVPLVLGLVSSLVGSAALGLESGQVGTAVGVGLGVAGITASILLSVVLVANRVVRHLELEVRMQVGGLLPLFAAGADMQLWPLGGWALSPESGGNLAAIISRECPRTTVELGAGSSTVLLVALLRRLQIDGSRLFSVEHDADFADRIRRHLGEELSLEIIHAPLRTEHEQSWYDTAILDEMLPETVDLLIVDGPPDGYGEGRRAQAVPYFIDRLADGATILVDDTDRRSERAMVDDWLAHHAGLSIDIAGRDHLILTYRR